MRALVWGIGGLAVVWCLYWLVGSVVISHSVEDWLNRPQAVMIDRQDVSVAGFPNRFDLTVTAPVVTDPATGITWQAPFVQVFAMTWKPWHLIAALPTGQTITLPDQVVTITSDQLRGSLQVTPDSDMALQSVVVETTNLALTSTLGTALQLDRAVLSTAMDSTRRNSHRLGLQVTNLTPPATELPLSLHLDAYLLLSAPLDRHAATTRPQLTGIELADLTLDWGDMNLNGAGSVAATSDGTAQGVVNLRIRNWRQLPDLLAVIGIVKPEIAPTLLRALELLAEDSPDPDLLELPLTFQNGRTSLGVLPIGPAPIIAYRQ